MADLLHDGRARGRDQHPPRRGLPLADRGGRRRHVRRRPAGRRRLTSRPPSTTRRTRARRRRPASSPWSSSDERGAVLGSLPPFEAATPWWQDIGPVVDGARERFGVDVTVLRLLRADRPHPPGGAVTYLAEAGAVGGSAPRPDAGPPGAVDRRPPGRPAAADLGATRRAGRGPRVGGHGPRRDRPAAGRAGAAGPDVEPLEPVAARDRRRRGVAQGGPAVLRARGGAARRARRRAGGRAARARARRPADAARRGARRGPLRRPARRAARDGRRPRPPPGGLVDADRRAARPGAAGLARPGPLAGRSRRSSSARATAWTTGDRATLERLRAPTSRRGSPRWRPAASPTRWSMATSIRATSAATGRP